ncbi:hypothetical protein [Streptomyces sp. NPDC001380]|uniref:hypothetical protein n=1 Tax=Streptomyces sp. NPDC001380 TaxID=3364566 RepID=UPI0036778092
MTRTDDGTDPGDRTAAERAVGRWAADGPHGRLLVLRGARGAGKSGVLRRVLAALPGTAVVECAGRDVDDVAAAVLEALGALPRGVRPRGTFRDLLDGASAVPGLVLLDVHLAGAYRGSAAPQAVLDRVVRHLARRGGPAGWVALEADASLRAAPSATTTAVDLPAPAGPPRHAPDPRAERTFDPADLPDLIGSPGFLAAADRAELVDALPLAWPDGVPHNSLAADVHYLDLLGVRPGRDRHGEWLAALHHRLVCQGAADLAARLADGAGLPWRTVWAHWLPAGRSADARPVPGPVEAVLPAVLDGDGRQVVVSRDPDVPDEDVDTGAVRARTEYVFDLATGERLGGPYRRTAGSAEAAPVRPADDGWERLTWSDGRLRAAGRVAAPRFPFEVTGGVRRGGDLVLAGADGIFRIGLAAPVDEEAPGWARTPFVEPLVSEALEDLPAAAVPPDPRWLAAPFAGLWRPAADDLPDGLADPGARAFLTGTGMPLASGRGTLWTGHLPEEGLEEWDREPDGSGGVRVLYRIGRWLGGDLLLDGSTGRVLLEDLDGDTEHAADALPAFCAMLRLVCEPGRTVRQVNRRYVADQLDHWLRALDAEAADGCWHTFLHERQDLDPALWGDEK